MPPIFLVVTYWHASAEGVGRGLRTRARGLGGLVRMSFVIGITLRSFPRTLLHCGGLVFAKRSSELTHLPAADALVASPWIPLNSGVHVADARSSSWQPLPSLAVP